MTAETPLDVEAIRGRLDATSPSMRVDIQVGGSTLRATANASDRPGFVEAVGDLVGAVTGGDLGPTTVTFADDEDGQDATFALHAANDLRRLLDENARLNAENERLTIQLHNSKACALRELEAQIRGDEAEAERDAMAAKLDAVRELHAPLEVDWTGGRSCRVCRGPNGSAVMWPCATIRSLDAAPEAVNGTAQPGDGGPETPGTGSGRGTGVAEASGTAQVRDAYRPEYASTLLRLIDEAQTTTPFYRRPVIVQDDIITDAGFLRDAVVAIWNAVPQLLEHVAGDEAA